MANGVVREARLWVGVFVAILLEVLTSAGAQQQLPGHSITSPAEVHKLAADWFLAGTAIPSTNRIVLSPGVPSRVGMIWSRTPLLTNDFEVTLTLTVTGAKEHTTRDSGFAFWYVQENVTKELQPITVDHVHNQEKIISNTWDIALKAGGFDLFGHRANFDGLSVAFCDSQGPAGLEPAVSAIVRDGTTALKNNDGVPSPDALKFNFREGKEVVVKIRVQASVAKVEIVGGGTLEAKGTFKAGGYVGFSAFGGMKGAVDAKERSDFVEITSIAIVNHDSSAKGEEVAVVPVATPAVDSATAQGIDASMQDKLAAASSFKDHRAESDAIKDLTNMVFKLVVETHPLRTEMANAVSALTKRIEAMEATFAKLKEELDKSTGHSLSSEFETIKKELTSLTSFAQSETKERHSRLEDLHENIKDVHSKSQGSENIDYHLNKLTDANDRTLQALTDGHQSMFGVSIAAIVFVLIAGLSLYNKFRQWEKKHVL